MTAIIIKVSSMAESVIIIIVLSLIKEQRTKQLSPKIVDISINNLALFFEFNQR
ncbi:hypothetical protein [Pseudoalteromonas sp. A601]|uniref:hypothetical protein n=1 Tax=Pseudoalteromonas sp. A601 TaxID=1967839 RepID=UPI0015944FD3|nr:hypothetical protein [Pseudoalteromonas sp. A601]